MKKRTGLSAQQIDSLFTVLRMIVAILISFVLMIFLLIWVSDEPIEAVKTFITGPFSTKRRMANIVEYAIPYTFTGLGMCFIYSVGRFSMIGEGVFISSAFSAACLAFALEGLNLPPVLYAAILIIAGTIVGCLIGFVPALLREKLHVNEVVVSIMLNYVLTFAIRYFLRMYMHDPSLSYNATRTLPKSANLLRFLKGTRIHTGIFIIIVMIFICYWVLRRTALGYQMRTVGQNSRFARYVGISGVSICLIAQVIGAGLAGMGGTVEMLGLYTRYQWENQTGYGNDGVFVAVLAQKNPLLVPIAALFLGYLRCGADVVNRTTDVPFEFVNIMQAVVIMIVAGEMMLAGFKKMVIYRNAKRNLEKEAAA